ncbi:MAG TPA: response regulator [Rhizomicrobium sp.]|nr:response regulator [Rhizomicrobium sp.]
MAKILAVEDEALVRILIVETLADAGHGVLEAADGESALDIVRQTPDLDLVVTDVRMSKMDGFSLARFAREVRPDLPVLFMTGYMGADVPANIPDAKVLQKPFDPDDLLAAIEVLLAAR